MTNASGNPPANDTPAGLIPLRFLLTGTYFADPAAYSVGEPAAMAAEDLEAVTAAADRWGVLDPLALVGAVRTTCGELDQVAAAITPGTPDGSDADEGPAVALPAGEAAQVRAALAAIADGGSLDGRLDAVREPDPRALASAALALLTRAITTTTPPGTPGDGRQGTHECRP
jgi:hypothetical protein